MAQQGRLIGGANLLIAFPFSRTGFLLSLYFISNHCYTKNIMSDNKERVHEWFVLVYKLPAEPTRHRASVWRKLRGAGAVYLQNGVAALPADSGGERTMRGVVQEIREVGGTVHLLRSRSVGDDASLVEAFDGARDEEYREVLDRCGGFRSELEKERAAGKFTFAELEENEEDLAKLEAWFGRIRGRDRFGAPLASEAEQAIAGCREDLGAFAASVYDAADHGSAGPAAS